MKKRGFTLAELLVAIGIVGVIAAITVPAINRIMPDKDKGIVIKAYKMINEINNDIFNDPSLYMFNDTDGCTTPNILRCNQSPLDENHLDISKYAYYNKYPYLLTEHLTLDDEDVSFTDGEGSFTTSDGTGWTIALKDIYSSEGKRPDSYTITIDTHNNGRQNCIYDSSNCTNPRLFQFVVDSTGAVTPAEDDYLTQAYLENSDDLNDRYADLKRAAELASE